MARPRGTKNFECAGKSIVVVIARDIRWELNPMPFFLILSQSRSRAFGVARRALKRTKRVANRNQRHKGTRKRVNYVSRLSVHPATR